MVHGATARIGLYLCAGPPGTHLPPVWLKLKLPNAKQSSKGAVVEACCSKAMIFPLISLVRALTNGSKKMRQGDVFPQLYISGRPHASTPGEGRIQRVEVMSGSPRREHFESYNIVDRSSIVIKAESESDKSGKRLHVRGLISSKAVLRARRV